MEDLHITAISMEGFNDRLDLFGNYTYDNESGIVGMASPCVPWTLGSSSVALVCVYSVVSVFGVLGNALVISVVYCMKGRRTSTDVYLVNLAAADLLFSATLPFWCVYAHVEWVFGTPLCKLLSGLQEATFYSGVLLLSCISLDRYLAIVKATQVASRKRHLVTGVCGAVWLGAGLLSLPALVQRQAFQPANAGRTVCHEHLSAESTGRWRVGVRVLNHALGFFAPLAVMLFCYSHTVAKLLQARNRQKHKAMRVILAVVLAFVGCWLPHNVTVLTDTLMRGGAVRESCTMRERVDLALQLTEALAFLHCAINPVLYAFIGQKFRNQLLRNLHACGLIGQSAYRRGTINSSSSRKTSVTM
ncbi:hypothetical protein COCON_G00193490 [Conger conger]|uniref:C-X-C chemokine receptor type 2 n=1 Tax=Conger conger TaxID=82655 RepID=A0A9Q1HQR5_CONCO|nr:C-X-C chemokine receptor type 1-like [Conger conger]KAJ8255485.1 hypothetical protein COCON_G00193490 [Conger conger]